MMIPRGYQPDTSPGDKAAEGFAPPAETVGKMMKFNEFRLISEHPELKNGPFRQRKEEVNTNLEITFDCKEVNWNAVAETLKTVGMAHYEPDMHRKAFESSHTTVFVYHDGRLIGFGRAISDGVYQAAVYDVAILPEFQGKGFGRTVMSHILSRISHCNVILYASIGKEDFYRAFGMRKMKTGMALFRNASAMAEKGFTE